MEMETKPHLSSCQNQFHGCDGWKKKELMNGRKSWGTDTLQLQFVLMPSINFICCDLSVS